MAPATLDSPRQRALRAVVAVALADGLADKSLRAISEAAGISHRMLIHHFGSKEALLVEVIRAVEDQQREILASLAGEAASDDESPGIRFWRHLRHPTLARQERLFFEVYGQALQGRPWAAPLLTRIVDDWVEPLADLLVEMGADPATAAVDARLGVAVCRGLLLDVLATGDDEAVDAAMARFERLVAAKGVGAQ
jgi:AcrR family transcriptional regulator